MNNLKFEDNRLRLCFFNWMLGLKPFLEIIKKQGPGHHGHLPYEKIGLGEDHDACEKIGSEAIMSTFPMKK